MSEPIPESVPTSSDRRSHRPTKRRALSPTSKQSADVDALFANPDREIVIPSGPKARNVAAPPEIVANVQGSSAGAGSGEFHVYKASRRREYERLRVMDEETARQEREREFLQKKEERLKVEEEKLSKNQAKRAKARARKEKGKMGAALAETQVDEKNGEGGVEVVSSGMLKKKLGAAKNVIHRNGTAETEDTSGNGDAPVAAEESAGITFHDDD